MAEQQSLFGPTADEVQRQMQSESQANAFKQAQLTPLQQLTYQGAQAGTNIGQAVSGMLGYKDPRLAQAEKAKAIQDALAKRGMDFNKPDEVYNYLADQFAAAGMGEQAIQAKLTGFDVALKGQKTEAEINELKARAAKEAQLKKTEISRLMAEKKAAQEANDPDLVAAIDGQIAKIQHIAPIHATEGTGNPDEKQVVFRSGSDPTKVLAKGEVQKTTPAKTQVSVGGNSVNIAGDEAGQKAFMTEIAKQHADYVKKGRDAEYTLGVVRNMTKLADMGVMSGPFANFQLQFAKIMGALGASSEDEKRLADRSQAYDAGATELVVKTLGGKLGGNVSNTDLAYVQKLVPQLENTPGARKKLLKFIEAKLEYEKDNALGAAQYTHEYRVKASKLKKGEIPEEDPFTGYKAKAFEFDDPEYKKTVRVEAEVQKLIAAKKLPEFDTSTAKGRAERAAFIRSLEKRIGD